MPSIEPSSVPRATAGAACLNSRPFGSSEPTLLAMTSRRSAFSTLAMISANPNTPIATATKSIPSVSSGMSKEKRATPEFTSVPTMPSSRPSTIIAIALSKEPDASTTAPISPTTISEKYSAGPNLNASSVSGGANAATSTVAKQPATKEPIAAMPSAAPARPRRAIWCPSRHVTTDDDSPGMLTRIAVVEPPYCEP
jgi:hypothetical protein